MPFRDCRSLSAYGAALTGSRNPELVRGAFFAKFLAGNDDSGRHGVLVPIEAHEHFPELVISDPGQNATRAFESIDCIEGRVRHLHYKYYQRYPERRITCLNQIFNDREHGLRLIVVFRSDSNGESRYYVDGLRQQTDAEFDAITSLLFGNEVGPTAGAFVIRGVDAPQFHSDENLDDLLNRFDEISDRGWIESLRTGDTGIGYTFETLVGVVENNDQTADFRGIEIKCKQIKTGAGAGGKINLFQLGPKWQQVMPMPQRIREIGQLNIDGRYSCYSQVTTTPNNLGLWLSRNEPDTGIDLFREERPLGDWADAVLARRLAEKHSRAVFVSAEVRGPVSAQRFRYRELVYCERPSLDNFMRLVESRRIVFEFTMSEKADGSVRNHGYPWRLANEGLLPELFSLRVRLR